MSDRVAPTGLKNVTVSNGGADTKTILGYKVKAGGSIKMSEKEYAAATAKFGTVVGKTNVTVSISSALGL